MNTDLSYGLTDALKLAGFDDTAEGGAFTKCCMDMGITPKLEYKYNCGTKQYDEVLNYSNDARINYDCKQEHNFCKTIRLVLDDGTTNEYTENGKNIEAGIKIISSLNPGIDISVNNVFKFSDELNATALTNGFSELKGYTDICNQLVFSENTGEDILDDQDISNNSMKMSSVKNNCLISQGRKYKLFLERGLLKLSFYENDCEYNTENNAYVGKYNSGGVKSIYKIDDKTKHMGKLYNIDGQGVAKEFVNPGYTEDSKQFEVIPKVASNGATVISKITNSTKTECENSCILDNKCAGYQFNTKDNICTLFENDMYPYDQTKKQPDINTNTYVRVPYNVNSINPGCKSQNVKRVSTDKLEDYSFHSDKMNDSDNCGIGQAIVDANALNSDIDSESLPTITKEDLAGEKEEILRLISLLTKDEKKILKDMGKNVEKMKNDLKEYKDIKEKKINGKMFDLVDGQLEDSNKKLNKEMTFLVGTSIASIVLLLVAINLQKK
jgi:hypothetical protein